MRDCIDRRVTLLKRVTSPTWGPSPPCKQALRSFFFLRFLPPKCSEYDKHANVCCCFQSRNNIFFKNLPGNALPVLIGSTKFKTSDQIPGWGSHYRNHGQSSIHVVYFDWLTTKFLGMYCYFPVIFNQTQSCGTPFPALLCRLYVL